MFKPELTLQEIDTIVESLRDQQAVAKELCQGNTDRMIWFAGRKKYIDSLVDKLVSSKLEKE